MSKFRVLSIDGGGMRGIVPGEILAKFEIMLKEKSGRDDASISDYFDMIAGTSSGGIITAMILAPSKADNSRPRFSARETVDLFIKRGGEIFDYDIFRKLISMDGFHDEKYSAKPLEEIVFSYLDYVKISEFIKPCLIPAYDIEARNTRFFTSHTAKKNKDEDFYAKDVVRATSSAPTYFEPSRIKSFSGEFYTLIDGGMVTNNPAMCAYAEVRSHFGNKAKDMILLSLGTGLDNRPYLYDKVKDWGVLRWARPLVDIMMTGSAEIIHYQMEQLFDAVDKSEQYLRVNSELNDISLDIDDASPENIRKLVAEGIRLFDDFRDELEKIADMLIENDNITCK